MQLEWGSFLDRILHRLIDRVNISLVAVFEPSHFLCILILPIWNRLQEENIIFHLHFFGVMRHHHVIGI